MWLIKVFKWIAQALFYNMLFLLLLGALAIVLLGVAFIIMVEIDTIKEHKDGLL
jgi:hypothetical protein